MKAREAEDEEKVYVIIYIQYRMAVEESTICSINGCVTFT